MVERRSVAGLVLVLALLGALIAMHGLTLRPADTMAPAAGEPHAATTAHHGSTPGAPEPTGGACDDGCGQHGAMGTMLLCLALLASAAVVLGRVALRRLSLLDPPALRDPGARVRTVVRAARARARPPDLAVLSILRC